FSLGGYFLGGGTISPSNNVDSGLFGSSFTGLSLVLSNELFEESCTFFKVSISSCEKTSSACLQECNEMAVNKTADIKANFFIRLIFTNVSPEENIKQVYKPLVYKKKQVYYKIPAVILKKLQYYCKEFVH
ncbi:hypothetical protein, partial [Kaistella sp.]|uniref:hypothetical protein n=1 Tax=Kaistella sp. TaxID=2782235 RepID=UPI002F91F20E